MSLKILQTALTETIKADALWLPLTDPALAEVAAPEWRFAPALTGFTGSSGDVLVARDRVALLTDSRYWVQASKELKEGIELLRDDPNAMESPWVAWFREVLPVGGVVGIDGRMFSETRMRHLEAELAPLGIRVLLCRMPTLVGLQAIPADVQFLPDPARSIAERIKSIRAFAMEPEHVLVTMCPEAVAWTLNLRNVARPASPVFYSRLAVAEDRVLLEADELIPEEVRQELAQEGVCVVDNLLDALADLIECTLEFDPRVTSAELAAGLREIWVGAIHERVSPFELAMSQKTSKEIKLIEEAMRCDGIALTEFYAELDERLHTGELLNEIDISNMLHEHRSRQAGFLGESFDTIVAYGANAAMPHYVPKSGEASDLLGNGLLLIDSGGQYWCGTTDVTRMTPVGELSLEDQAEAGLVTKAMLRLAHQKFPERSLGASIDAIARSVLWSEGFDYGHGTGHGVGFVLNVHEGPVRLSPRSQEPLVEGNVLSNEPGLYREGVRGIRVENLMVAEPCPDQPGMLQWKMLTCVPIDIRTLPATGIGEETKELNAYNAWVRERLYPSLSVRARLWIDRVTQALPISS